MYKSTTHTGTNHYTITRILRVKPGGYKLVPECLGGGTTLEGDRSMHALAAGGQTECGKQQVKAEYGLKKKSALHS